MNDVFDKILNFYKLGGNITKLILLNFFILISLGILTQILLLFNITTINIASLFSLNSELVEVLYKPWTLFTNMFVHKDFGHLFWNMVLLYFSGTIFKQLIGDNKILSVYVIGGFIGSVISITAYNLFPLFTSQGTYLLLGSSGAVMTILLVVYGFKPDYKVRVMVLNIDIPLVLIVIIMLLSDVLNFGKLDGTGHFAHLGGAAWGYYMGSQLKKGKDVSAWFDNWIDKLVNIFKKKPKMKVSYTSNEKPKPPRDDYEYNAQKQTNQQKLDAILDKIKVGGYETLSKAEKEFLANY